MKKYLYPLYCIVFFIFVTNCDDMYEIHRKYLDESETVYLGMPKSIKAYGGVGRIKLTWKLNDDPKIDFTNIYWNNKKDSITVEVNRIDSIIEKIIEIPEGKYQFELINRSKDGHKSLPVSLSAESFGDEYKERLYNRVISNIIVGSQIVTFNINIEEECMGTYFTYLNSSGQNEYIFIEPQDTEIEIADFLIGGNYSHYSLYLPQQNAIDTIITFPEIGNFPNYYTLSKTEWESLYSSEYVKLTTDDWSITASSEELNGEGAINGRATTLLDGDLNTFWHSKWLGEITGLPYQIDIDMKNIFNINSIELARRSNNKDTKRVELRVSFDKEVWSSIGFIEYPNSPTPNSLVLLFPEGIQGRYLRLTVVESNSAPSASLSEISITTKK